MFVNLSKIRANLVKEMYVGGEMTNLWLISNHIKQAKEWTTLVFHTYDTKYCKALTIDYYNI